MGKPGSFSEMAKRTRSADAIVVAHGLACQMQPRSGRDSADVASDRLAA